MICPRCGNETALDTRQQAPGQFVYCSHCGTLLRMGRPLDAGRTPPSPGLAQKQAAPPDATPIAPGPLLTGRVALDTALGFLEEIVAVGLIVYAIALVGGSGFDESLVRASLPALGAVVTAAFLFWHAATMRKRYPTYARGSERGRFYLLKGRDQLVTLVFGVAVLVVLFPLGGLLLCVGSWFGPVGWLIGLMVAYCLGFVARSMSRKAIEHE